MNAIPIAIMGIVAAVAYAISQRKKPATVVATGKTTKPGLPSRSVVVDTPKPTMTVQRTAITARAAPLKTTSVSKAPSRAKKPSTATKKTTATTIRAAPMVPISSNIVKPKTTATSPAKGLRTTSVTSSRARYTQTQRKAAQALDTYLRGGGLERGIVKAHQRNMGGLTVDGVPGPLTEKRANAILARTVSWPHIEAAKSLYKYYRDGGRSKSSIKNYQRKMGEITVDGLVGPQTKKRVRAITNINWQ